MEKVHLKVLELFSGIGGMHAALKLSGVSGEVLAAIDINSVANEVYSHNFPQVKVFRRNIQKVSAAFVNKLGANTILMSPPCQPFTRLGHKKDLEDKRCVPLAHILTILPDLIHLRYLLVENVTGFENSEAGEQLRNRMNEIGFEFREMMVTPLQLGIPNSRERYYMIAVRKPLTFVAEIPSREDLNDHLIKTILERALSRQKPSCVGDVLDADDSEDCDSVPDEVLRKRAWILDIATKPSTKTCCFTKSYTHYVEGTGSVYCPYDEETVRRTYETAQKLGADCDEYVDTLRTLKMRFFTPREVQRILCFPDSFSYPPDVTRRQKYRLLGNSINVDVVSRLIRIMTNCTEI